MTKPTPAELLATPMLPNDADATTVRGYLRALLREVWTEEEGFSGKRPFGNSSWQSEVQESVVKAWPDAGYGTLDKDGYLNYDRAATGEFDAAMVAAIEAL